MIEPAEEFGLESRIRLRLVKNACVFTVFNKCIFTRVFEFHNSGLTEGTKLEMNCAGIGRGERNCAVSFGS